MAYNDDALLSDFDDYDDDSWLDGDWDFDGADDFADDDAREDFSDDNG